MIAWSRLITDETGLYWSQLAGTAAPSGELGSRVSGLRESAAAACPGRTAEIISMRVTQLMHQDPVNESDDYRDLRHWHEHPGFSVAERALIEVVEQFILDVHGVTDDQFATLREHYGDKELMGMLYHLALEDGFTKLHATMTDPGE